MPLRPVLTGGVGRPVTSVRPTEPPPPLPGQGLDAAPVAAVAPAARVAPANGRALHDGVRVTVRDVGSSSSSAASSPGETPRGQGTLDAVYARLRRGELPPAHLLQHIERAPPGMPAAGITFDPAAGVDYAHRLDVVHDLLAHAAGRRPHPWAYPPHATHVPHFNHPLPFGRAAVAALDRRERARGALDTFERWTARDAWSQLHVRATALTRRAPARLVPMCEAIEHQLQTGLQSSHNARDERAAADSARRNKMLAQLAFTLAALRGHHAGAARALGHYARLAESELTNASKREPTYEAHPLPAATLHAWLEVCPPALLSRLPLWHPGLRTTVTEETFATLLTRLQPSLVGPTLAARALASLAGQGRLPEPSWIGAWVAARTAELGCTAADADAEAARQLRRALLARGAGGADAWPQVPLNLVLGPHFAVSAWRRRMAHLLAIRPDEVLAHELLQWLGGGHGADEALRLIGVSTAHQKRFADPVLGEPLVWLLCQHDAPRAAAEVFLRLRLRRDMELDAPTVRLLFDQLARAGAWPLLARLLDHLDRAGLAYCACVTEALADVRVSFARHQRRRGAGLERTGDGQVDSDGENDDDENPALPPWPSPTAVVAAWRRGEAPFADAAAPSTSRARRA